MSRIEKVRNIIKKKKLDAILITDMANVRYLSNFTGSNAQLFLTPDENMFFTDGRYETQSKKEVKDFKTDIYIGEPFYKKISEYLRDKKIKKIGFEDNNLTYKNYTKVKKAFQKRSLYPVSDELNTLRVAKDKNEIRLMKKAIKIAEDSLKELKNYIEPGVSEKELAEKFERITKEKGSEGLAFDTLLVSGPNSAIIHGKPTNRKLKAKDLLMIDFGCIYKGYRSDQTVTYGIKELHLKAIHIYHTVKEAQELAIESIKPGVNFSKPAKIVDQFFESKGHKLVHSLSHGIGLETHEYPLINSKAKGVFEEGMVFSVEPGIYIEGFGGIRIEDLVVVTKNGCKKLTTLPKDLEIL